MNHSDIAHGFHLFMDGNAWCAVGPHFQDLQVSDAGFGNTPEMAVEALRRELANQSWWHGKELPTFDKFKVHENQ